MRPSKWSIISASALMLAAVFVIGAALGAGEQDATLPAAETKKPAPILTEAGVFERTGVKAIKPEVERALTAYYQRRAYPGGPPSIPHPLFDEKSMGGKSCLGCHKDGGYMPMWKAYTPITPHPEMTNCRSCHVRPEAKDTFEPTTFAPAQHVELPKGAIPGAPPRIPHPLDMRSNCVACHGGPAAPKEIRTSHPERANCRQCHVTGAEQAPAFQRPLDGGAQ